MEGGIAAIASLSGPEGEFMVSLRGTAEKVLNDSLKETNVIFGFEPFALASAAIALGGRLRRKRLISFLDDNAA